MRIFLGCVLILLLGCVKEEDAIEISGKVNFATEGLITLSKMDPGSKLRIVDTIELINNQYFFHEFKVDTPDFYRLNFYDKQYVNLILDDENIDLVVDGNSKFGYAKITGSADHELLSNLSALVDEFEDSNEYKSYTGAMRKAVVIKDSLSIDSLRNVASLLLGKRNSLIRNYLQNQDLSLAHIQASSLLNDSASLQYKHELALELRKKYPTSKQALVFERKNKMYRDNRRVFK